MSLYKGAVVSVVFNGSCGLADMGNYTAEKLGMPPPLSPQQSVEGMLKVVRGLSQKDNGRFFDYEGKSLDY